MARESFMLHERLSAAIRERSVDSTEYQIASALMDALPTIHEESITAVARRCSVSVSTLSKFVRSLGYADYREFKEDAGSFWALGSYEAAGENITDYLCGHSSRDYLSLLFADLIALFGEAGSEPVKRTVELLHDSSSVGAFGELYGQTAAANLQTKLSFYRRFVFTTSSNEKADRFLESAGKDAVVLVFSNSGRFLDRYRGQQGEQRRTSFESTKARVVLVTSNPAAASDPRVDVCVLLPSNGEVRNHPLLFQAAIELIAAEYQRAYGLPASDE